MADPRPTGSEPIVLIGRATDEIDAKAEQLLDGFIIALQDFDTETLEAIADRRHEIRQDGWMQKMIEEYVEVWR